MLHFDELLLTKPRMGQNCKGVLYELSIMTRCFSFDASFLVHKAHLDFRGSDRLPISLALLSLKAQITTAELHSMEDSMATPRVQLGPQARIIKVLPCLRQARSLVLAHHLVPVVSLLVLTLAMVIHNSILASHHHWVMPKGWRCIRPSKLWLSCHSHHLEGLFLLSTPIRCSQKCIRWSICPRALLPWAPRLYKSKDHQLRVRMKLPEALTPMSLATIFCFCWSPNVSRCQLLISALLSNYDY